MIATEHFQLRIINVIYEHAFLGGRRGAGLQLSGPEARRLDALESQLVGDPGWCRREHRRVTMQLPAQIKCFSSRATALITSLSAGGFHVTTSTRPAMGAPVMVIIQTDERQYSFPCTVTRLISLDDGRCQLILSMCGIPLEVRYRPGSARVSQERKIAEAG